jgi:hypothetical protein
VTSSKVGSKFKLELFWQNIKENRKEKGKEIRKIGTDRREANQPGQRSGRGPSPLLFEMVPDSLSSR